MEEGVTYWPALCGNDSRANAFWDVQLTWNTSSPEFTRCFEDTALTWALCGYLWISAVIYFPFLLSWPRVMKSSRLTLICIIKLVLCAILTFVALADAVHNSWEGAPPAAALGATIRLLTYVLAAIMVWLDFSRGVTSSGILIIFWLLHIVVGTVPLTSYVLRAQRAEDGLLIEDIFDSVTFYISYTLIVITFIVHCLSDDKALTEMKEGDKVPLLDVPALKDEKPSPEKNATFISRLFFFWITRLIIDGYRRPLIFGDLWDLLPADRSSTIVPSFLNFWKKHVKETGWRFIKKKETTSKVNGYTNTSNGTSTGSTGEPEERPPPLPPKNKHKNVSSSPAPTANKYSPMSTDDQSKKKQIKLTVWKPILQEFGPYYLLGGFFKFIYDIISFVSPQILSLLITFVGEKDPFLWRGYLYVAALFGVSMLRTTIVQQYWHSCFVTGMRLRTAVIAIIYRKALALNNSSKRESTTGEIVNMMSVDTQKLQDAPSFMHMLWSAPLTIAVAMYFLWQELGVSTLAGLFMMIVLIPVNAWVATNVRALQVTQMKQKDSRIKLMNEILSGIKVLKLYAWEDSFRKQIDDIRAGELATLRKMSLLSVVSAISWNMAPYLVALASFGAFVLSSPDNVLDANKAFVSLSLFNLMSYPISTLPGVVAYGIQANVAITRINKFLRNEELDPDNVIQDPKVGEGIKISGASFKWGDEQGPVLKKINMTVPEGKLVAVVGTVGSGKSSLLSAMLGDMEVMSGKVHLRGSVAYVSQQAWIQNATVKDNILFGKRQYQTKYKNVIEACALKPDLEILPGGDMTEIGERGINLSGGQKQRVSLARAVYQNKDIYLFDDPLSAVDSHVGKHIFENVIGPKGNLRRKTRVLVTNALHFLPYVDNVVVLKEGVISETGTYQELLQNNGPFAEFVMQYLNEQDDDEIEEEHREFITNLRRTISSLSGAETGSASEREYLSSDGTPATLRRRGRKRSSKYSRDSVAIRPGREKANLVVEEVAETGNVKLSVFTSYYKACGVLYVGMALTFYLVMLASQASANIWLSEWSTDPPTVNGTQDLELRDLRLGVYGGIGCLQALGVLFQLSAIALASVQGSRVLHSKLMGSILRAPMSFFDTTPLGRVLNRFSKDVDTVDFNIPLTTRVWLSTFSGVATTLFIISYSTPIFLTVLIPLGAFYYFVQRFYISCSRQLKRIESVRRSPIYAYFSETLTGTSTIRAYGVKDRFIEHSDQLVDENNMAYYPNIVSQRWLGIYLESIGNLIVLFAGLFAVIQRDSIDAGLAGLSVSYALQVTGALNMVVRMTCDLETYIVAVERIQEYADCPKEADTIIADNRPADDWPQQGHVTFQQYSTRYRPGLDLVLRGIDCSFKPGERVGIVGRTGAGKSSLTLALFRIIESAAGSIIIDNQKISEIGLDDLRSKLTIIPQDPVLFSGTLRMNLDPFNTRSDEDIWSALELASLKTFVESLPEGLEHMCAEGGENISVGQRQLVCLARALLRKTRILILDEATAAIDLQTDELIQETIRSEFKDCTVITIAHRLNTVMDYDRIAVLDSGNIAEFASPTELLRNTKGIFYGMTKDAGLI